MVVKIYDYDDRAVEVTIPDEKVISAIFVVVLSGDETGIILFTDGTTKRFNASFSRIHSFWDGCYVVSGKNIQKWIDFEVTECNKTISYARQETFDDREW